MNHDDHDDYPETYSAAIYWEPKPAGADGDPPSFWWVIGVLGVLLALMLSISSCNTTDGTNQISAGWETVKSRIEVGVGFKADKDGIAFPLLVRWLAKPTPDDVQAERIEQTLEAQK